MEYLIGFLKSSTIIDFAFIFGTVFVGVLLIVVGVVMLFVAKTRKFFFVYLAIAFLPLILALAGTGVRWYANERLLSLNKIDPSSQQADEIRQNILPEYAIMLLIGAGSTSLPLLIGIAGLILKRNRQITTTT
jgi:hypothetical protein